MITAVPFGYALPSGDPALGVAQSGSSASWQQTLATDEAGGATVSALPAVTLFGQPVAGAWSQATRQPDGFTDTPVAQMVWVVEAGARLWIVQLNEDASVFDPAGGTDLTISATGLGTATTVGTVPPPADPVGIQSQPMGVVPAISGSAPSTAGSPTWWNGTCDVNSAPGSSLQNQYAGVYSCGKFNCPDKWGPNGSCGTIATVNYSTGVHGNGPENEWQCAELSSRYMYLRFGVKNYAANGNTVVHNYQTSYGGGLVAFPNAAHPSGQKGNIPVPGDVVSLGTKSNANGYGHTGIVTGYAKGFDFTNGNGSILLMDQNFNAGGKNHISVTNWVVNVGWPGWDGVQWLHSPTDDPQTSAPAPVQSAPVLTINNLANNSTVQGTVVLTVSSTQALGDETYFLDNQPIAGTTGFSAPYLTTGANSYTLSLDTTKLTSGAVHHIYAEGHNASTAGGLLGVSPTIGFTVSSSTAGSSFMAGNQVDVFGRGSDGHLHRWAWDSLAGSAYQDLGGTIVSDPSGFYNSSLSQYDVFARGTDGALYHWWWNPSSGGWKIQDLGGNFVGNPAVVYNAALGQEDVFGRGPDSQLYHWFWNPTAGSWTIEHWGGGDLAGNPTVYIAGTAQLDVFGRGSDGHLHRWSQDPGGAAVYADLAGGFVGDPTGLYNPSLSQFDVFGRGPDGALYHWYWNPGSGGWRIQDWGGNFLGDPTSYFVASAGQEDVFGRGPDGHLYRWSWDTTAGLVIQNLGGDFVGDPVGNYDPPLSQFDVFGGGPDGALYHWYWNPGSGGWQIQDWGGDIAAV